MNTSRKHSLPAGQELSSTAVPLKRLRGGGGANDDDLYDEQDFVDDAPDDTMDIPDEEYASSLTDTADTALNFANLTPAQLKRWSRPPIPEELRDSSTADLHLQWLDIDMIGGNPLAKSPNKSRREMPGAAIGTVPIIRVYGVNDSGNSVTAFIHGYTPYGYFALPEGYELTSQNRDAVLGEIRVKLNGMLISANTRSGFGKKSSGDEGELVHGVEYIDDRKSIMGYNTSHTRFLKVHLKMPTLVPTLKRLMEEGVDLKGITLIDKSTARTYVDNSATKSFQPFECNVPFVLRFMIDEGITGAGWLTFPKGSYSVRPDNKKMTHCQIEADVCFDDIIAHEPEDQWNKVAPLRILSLDIECQGRKGYFPEAEKDPVIQIANCLSVYGEEKPLVQNVFTLKGCLPIVGAQVIASETEEDLLLKWQVFMQACDPDIITGYNVQNFDIPYILDRADALSKNKGIKKKLSDFKRWGRIKGTLVKMRETTFQSAAYGKRNNMETTIDGRVIFDMLPYMQRNHKLSSYTLNSVCSELLGQQKEDVHHSIISDLQNGSDEDRHRLAVYCLKDALLPQLLMNKLSVLVNYIEMARVTGVPMSFLITRGQQIKVFSMILRKCRNEKLLVPTLTKRGPGNDAGYEGATVLDPIKNYYETPIATLDFASLYPSIMQAYNLCYSTLACQQDAVKLDPSQYKKSDNGHIFVHSHVKKGILPTILGELLSARKRAKKDMKNAPTEFEKAVQNGRQLALKVSANSVYGFTGAGVGQLPCLPIASSVTSYGRFLLEKTKEFVEQTYTVANGYEFDAQVIYGDTDSVMVKFGTDNVKDTFPLAIEAANKCSKIFPEPILLEFEKVYYPYLLM